jgi:dipeptidyl aminopeptidase B
MFFSLRNRTHSQISCSFRPTSKPIRVTDTGTPSFFNGVPDWVYEEEVFASDSTLWFSPSSTLLAFLSFDETKVDTFTYPVYNPTSDSYEVVPYTHDVKMKYPKPGYNNPIVSLHVFDISSYRSSSPPPTPSSVTITLDWEGRFDVTDSVISEVTWVGNETLLVKETNRNADKGSIVLFDLSTRGRLATSVKGRIVRKLGKAGEEGDDGWIDHVNQAPRLSPHVLSALIDSFSHRRLNQFIHSLRRYHRAGGRPISTSCLQKMATITSPFSVLPRAPNPSG